MSVGGKYKEATALEAIDKPLDPRAAVKLNGDTVRGSCVAVVTPGLAHTLLELMAGLFVIGVVGGTLDVAQNAQGVRVEAAYARPVMTSMHAFYSLGAIFGSLAGGGLAWAGVALFCCRAPPGWTAIRLLDYPRLNSLCH